MVCTVGDRTHDLSNSEYANNYYTTENNKDLENEMQCQR
jgi:hypothetical protein